MVDVNNTCSISLTHQDGYMDPCGYFVQNNLIFKISCRKKCTFEVTWHSSKSRDSGARPQAHIPALKANTLVHRNCLNGDVPSLSGTITLLSF